MPNRGGLFHFKKLFYRNSTVNMRHCNWAKNLWHNAFAHPFDLIKVVVKQYNWNIYICFTSASRLQNLFSMNLADKSFVVTNCSLIKYKTDSFLINNIYNITLLTSTIKTLIDIFSSFPYFSTPNNPLGENFTKSDKEIDESIR